MQKIVINTCFGGFGLSHEGVMAYAKEKGIKLYALMEKRTADGHMDFHNYEEYKGQEDTFCIHYSKKPLKNGKCDDKSYFSIRDIERNDPALVAVIKKLGEKASGDYADLKVVEIPDKVKWVIDEYDGSEEIHEEHRSWC